MLNRISENIPSAKNTWIEENRLLIVIERINECGLKSNYKAYIKREYDKTYIGYMRDHNDPKKAYIDYGTQSYVLSEERFNDLLKTYKGKGYYVTRIGSVNYLIEGFGE